MGIKRALTVDLFSFSDYRLFLNEHLIARKNSQGSFSVRNWCRRLGLKSPATLNMILRGHRNPGEEVVDKLSHYFDFSSEEREYFENLVKLAKHSGNEAKRCEILERIQRLYPNNNGFKEVDLSLFAFISNWYYSAIISLTSLSDFKEDGLWISKKLRSKITPKEGEAALQTLLKLGILKRSANGKIGVSKDHFITPFDLPSEAIKKFHEQHLDLARSAIREIEPDSREYSSSSFTISLNDLPAIKKEIRRLRNNLLKKFDKCTGDSAYQFNFQIFPLTEQSIVPINKRR